VGVVKAAFHCWGNLSYRSPQPGSSRLGWIVLGTLREVSFAQSISNGSKASDHRSACGGFLFLPERASAIDYKVSFNQTPCYIFGSFDSNENITYQLSSAIDGSLRA